MPRGLVAARHAVGKGRQRWATRQAVRQARRFCQAHPAPTRICWDLDNTLVGSGALIRAGSSLEAAVVAAGPVANMLAFFQAVSIAFPGAEHVVLTARPASLRSSTLAWLARHELTPTGDAVYCVPLPALKVRVWRELARGARLVIVDDLSYDHESEVPSIHEGLVEIAARIACIHVGFDDIGRIEADAGTIDEVVSKVAAAVGASAGEKPRLPSDEVGERARDLGRR